METNEMQRVRERLDALETQQAADSSLIACLLATHQDTKLLGDLWSKISRASEEELRKRFPDAPHLVNMALVRMAHWTGVLQSVKGRPETGA